MADHEQHHAEHGKKGGGLKKKLGPLPVWGWIIGGAGVLGVFYYLHKSSSSTTASTTPTATSLGDGGVVDPGAGGGGDSGAAPVDTTGLATGTVTTDQLDSDIQAISAQLAAQSNGITDSYPSFGQEIGDVTSAVTALKSAGFLSSPPAKGSSATAKGKASGLTIKEQLEDVKVGLLTKSQLGPNAKKQLAKSGGNVTKAIAARAKPVKKPTTRKTPVKAK